MLEEIQNLPPGTLGLRATGRVDREDYERVVEPALEAARREGRRVRFLYWFGPEFDGFTAAAAWEDLRVGVRHLPVFERCAIVSDEEWVRSATRVMGAVMPCPVRVFDNADYEDAVEWLQATPQSSLDYRILEDERVLVVEPQTKLRAEDFDALEGSVDAYLERAGGTLRGLVVHASAFPGWEDLGSALRHLRFLRDHHREVSRVALAVNSKMAALGPALAEHFVEAEFQRFDADALPQAIAWASRRNEDRAGSVGFQGVVL